MQANPGGPAVMHRCRRKNEGVAVDFSALEATPTELPGRCSYAPVRKHRCRQTWSRPWWARFGWRMFFEPVINNCTEDYYWDMTRWASTCRSTEQAVEVQKQILTGRNHDQDRTI
jgi:hypothetical protein